MKKAILFTLALACLVLSTGCSMSSGDDGEGDGTAITATTFSVTLDTASGSEIPAQFSAVCSWAIEDSIWQAGDVYTVQAYFAGTGGTPVTIGEPYTLESVQKGSGSYTFKIPDDGLPSTVKKPYELTFSMKKGGTEILKSAAFTFTDGKLAGVYKGSLYYYTEFDGSGNPTKANEYEYKVTLVQYGDVVLASNVIYLDDQDEDGVYIKKPQTCTVIMTASVENGKTKLTGTGTFTGSDGETESYSGEAYVFGDGRSISCDAYWLATDAAKKECGTFSCDKQGTASISGTVTIVGAAAAPELKFIEAEEGVCVAAILYGLDADELEDNAGAMTMGVVSDEGDNKYSFAYTIENIPAGEYYIFFGGIDQGDDVEENDRFPDTAGEAIGLCGEEDIDDLDVLTDWIDGSPSDATIAAIEALDPIVVKEGEPVLNLDFTAYVR